MSTTNKEKEDELIDLEKVPVILEKQNSKAVIFLLKFFPEI